MWNTLWKFRNFTATIFSQKFREINFLLKKFTLDGFDEKKLWFFHTVPQCGNWRNSLSHFICKKEITKELILTKLFLVRENFSQSVSRKNIPSSFFDARIDFTENSVKEVCLDFTKYFSIFWWIFSTLYGNYLLISSWQKTLGHAHAIHSYISWGEIFSPAHKLIKQINCFPTWYE